MLAFCLLTVPLCSVGCLGRKAIIRSESARMATVAGAPANGAWVKASAEMSPIGPAPMAAMRSGSAPLRKKASVKGSPAAVGGDGRFIKARVVFVNDGDTFMLKTGAGKAKKMRLHGVDSPESKQVFGQKARDYAWKLVGGKEVTVEIRGTDPYDRIIGEIHLEDGRHLGEELVRTGNAWQYKRYVLRRHRKTREYVALRGLTPEQRRRAFRILDLERTARREGIGLWAQTKPEPPWRYRWRVKKEERRRRKGLPKKKRKKRKRRGRRRRRRKR